MANFNTHFSIAIAAGTGAALVAVNVHLIVTTDMLWLIFQVRQKDYYLIWIRATQDR